jgi:hypothetical protein
MKGALAFLLLLFCSAAWSQRLPVSFDQSYPGAPVSEADDFVGEMVEGRYDLASDAMTDCAAAEFAPPILQRHWESLVARLGAYQDRSVKAADLDGTLWHIHVLCSFQRGDADVIVDFATFEDMDQPTGVRFVDEPGGRLPDPSLAAP